MTTAVCTSRDNINVGDLFALRLFFMFACSVVTGEVKRENRSA